MIKFYSTKGKYGVFSNFYKSPVFLDDLKWPTSEHFYQAQKFLPGTMYDENKTIRESIRLCDTAREAADMGRSLSIRDDWESIKYSVMKRVITAKFTQYRSFGDLLLETGDEELIEDSPTDYIWGCGEDGTGLNWLGKVLMEVRTELKGMER